jgi:2-iminobutanoate/2-iminopropanoate deaminase
MPKKTIPNAELAKKVIGPYSPALVYGNLLFVSGQIPLNSQGSIPPSIEEQAKQVMENLKTHIESAGCKMDDIVQTTIFLADMSKFQAVNEIYQGYFSAPFPTRCTVGVNALPKGVLIEISAIAGKN